MVSPGDVPLKSSCQLEAKSDRFVQGASEMVYPNSTISFWEAVNNDQRHKEKQEYYLQKQS